MNLRIKYIDVIRVVATIMVVTIHVSGWFSLVPNSVKTSIDTDIAGALSACAVPLFFMISGALLLSPKYDLSIRKLLWKIFKIGVIWVVWGAAYAILKMDTFSWEKLAIWTVKGPFHFWFFEYLVFVYLLAPLFRAVVEYKDGILVRYFLICWAIFGIARFSFNGLLWHHEEISVITGKIHYELCDFSGYFVLGYFLSNVNSKRNKRYMWGVLFLAFAALQYLISSLDIISVSTYSFTFVVLAEAISVFMFCRSVSNEYTDKPDRLLKTMSSTSLGVFIIHPLVLEFLIPKCIWTLPVFLRVVILVVIVYAISFSASYLLSKVQPVKKWLLTV